MTPALCVARFAGQAGLVVRTACVGQALGCHARVVAAVAHARQRRQVFRSLDAAARAEQYRFRAELRQAVQPQALDLVELRGVAVGAVILIVVVQSKQREDLVDRIDLRLIAARLSLPSCGP